MYYLQSRYYDPMMGRFINADDVSFLGVSGTELGYNLFAYCENNPINNKDSSGHAITPANVIGAVIGVIGGAVIGAAIASYFRLTGWKKWACTASVSALIGVVGYLAGPSVYAAIKPIIVKAISTGTLLVNRLATWIQQLLGIVRPFAEKAARNVSQFYVSTKHLYGSNGNYAKFITNDMETIRGWISTALLNGTNFIANSSDSYYIIYNLGEAIGTKGQQCIKVVFDIWGRIITAYPIKG